MRREKFFGLVNGELEGVGLPRMVDVWIGWILVEGKVQYQVYVQMSALVENLSIPLTTNTIYTKKHAALIVEAVEKLGYGRTTDVLNKLRSDFSVGGKGGDSSE